MLLSKPVLACVAMPTLTMAFLSPSWKLRQATAQRGYLDDLSNELYAPDASSSREEVDTEKMNLDKDQIDRYGVGSWEGFVDFDEFVSLPLRLTPGKE